MRRTSLAACILALSMLGCAVLGMATAPSAVAATSSKPQKMNPKVLKPLQAALELANAGSYPEADVELQKADAVPDKSPYEQFQIDELAGFVDLKQGKYDSAALHYERGLDSGLLPPEQVNDRLRLLSQLFLQTQPRNVQKSGEYGKKWLAATGTRDPMMLGLVGQADYFSDNYGEAITYMKEAVEQSAAAGKKPEENWLLILQSSYSKLKNSPGVIDATTQLVRWYPRKEHWITLTSDLLSQAASKDRQILQVYRLMYQVDAMHSPEDFVEAANVAILLGFPGDALKFLDKGFSSGILAEGGDKAKSQALLDNARRQADADQKSLPQFEKEANAAPQGEADVKLGEALLSYGEAAKGLAAIQRGIAKGGVKNPDEANLSLGRAYLLAGNAPEAVKAFAQVTSPQYAQLGQLWAIYAGQQQ